MTHCIFCKKVLTRYPFKQMKIGRACYYKLYLYEMVELDPKDHALKDLTPAEENENDEISKIENFRKVISEKLSVNKLKKLKAHFKTNKVAFEEKHRILKKMKNYIEWNLEINSLQKRMVKINEKGADFEKAEHTRLKNKVNNNLALMKKRIDSIVANESSLSARNLMATEKTLIMQTKPMP